MVIVQQSIAFDVSINKIPVKIIVAYSDPSTGYTRHEYHR